LRGPGQGGRRKLRGDTLLLNSRGTLRGFE
jgi:hypothetical protein